MGLPSTYDFDYGAVVPRAYAVVGRCSAGLGTASYSLILRRNPPRLLFPSLALIRRADDDRVRFQSDYLEDAACCQ